MESDGSRSLLPCSRCDYPLAGLNLDKMCPECGLPVADSQNRDIASKSIAFREELDESLRQVGTCFLIELVALLLLPILAVMIGSHVRGFVAAWLLASTIPVATLIIWVRIARCQRCFTTWHDEWARVRRITLLERIGPYVPYGVIACLLMSILSITIAITTAAASGEQLFVVLAFVMFFAAIALHALYFAWLAVVVRDVNTVLGHATEAKAAARWKWMWPLLWLLALPLGFIVLGLGIYVFVMISVAAWLFETAGRVRKLSDAN